MRKPVRAMILLALAGLALLGRADAARAQAKPQVVKLGGSISKVADGAVLRAIVEIAPGYHINAHEPDEPFLIPTVLTISAPDAQFQDPEYPAPASERFEFAPDKPMLVYSGRIEIVAQADRLPSGPGRAKLRYQACDDERCLPPATVEAFLAIASADGPAPADPAVSEGGTTDPSWLTSWLRSASLPAAIGMTLLLGLTLNLTPCVYPLISVTIGYFGNQASGSRRTLGLASVYVIGITLSFAALGVSASLAGGLFGAPLQHPIVLVGLAILMVALAGSSFGFYEIRAPSALVSRFGGSSTGLGGALLMGLTMGIVAAPCIGPVVLGLLVYVGSEREVAKGLLLFLSLGLGMGLPYVALALAAGSLDRLPRAGEWLSWMNRFFGVLLLAMAIYFVSPLLDGEILRIFVPLFVGAAALYLGFVEPSGRSLPTFTLLRRTGGVVGIFLAVWLGLPQAQAGDGIRWEPLSLDAIDRAVRADRPAVVEFSAAWCLPCLEMERSTFVDPALTEQSESFSMLRADVTEESAANDRLLQEFQVHGVPTIILYDRQGVEVDRVVGFVDARRLSALMRSAAAAAAQPDSGNSVGT